MLDTCDKCLTKIENNRCSCGIWYDGKKEQPAFIQTLERAIYAYNFQADQGEMGDCFTADHFTGTCIALFKGEYGDAMKVRDFIERGFV